MFATIPNSESAKLSFHAQWLLDGKLIILGRTLLEIYRDIYLFDFLQLFISLKTHLKLKDNYIRSIYI